MQPRISVVINTYNAECYLEEVLISVKDFDEVVICDMESTDATASIARRQGCRLITFPKGNHKICEPARDFAIHSATYEWVLVIDADEIVPEKLREYLYRAIADENFDCALAIARVNKFMGKAIHSTPDYQLRFFKKDRTIWPAIIHARPIVDCEVKKVPAERELSLIHLDDPTVAERIIKMNVYTDYEVEKRCRKRYGYGKLFLRPVWFFIKNYIIGGGFKDGKRGVAHAYMASVYQIMLMSKVLECKIRKNELL